MALSKVKENFFLEVFPSTLSLLIPTLFQGIFLGLGGQALGVCDVRPFGGLGLGCSVDVAGTGGAGECLVQSGF